MRSGKMKLGQKDKMRTRSHKALFLRAGVSVAVLALVATGTIIGLKRAGALPCGTICQRMLSWGYPESSSVVDAAKRGDAENNGDPRYVGAQCALWLAEVGQPNVFRHVVTEDEYNRGQFELSMYGWCATYGTPTGMKAINIQPGNDNGSIRLTAHTMQRGVGINDTHVPAYVDIAKFVDGAEVVQGDDGDIYRRELRICRCNGTESNPSNDCFADVAADKNCGIDRFVAEVKMPGNTLKVNYVRKDNECYGRPGTTSNWTAGPYKDDDKDKRIATDEEISELIAAGYTFEGMNVNRGNAWLDGDWVNADVTNGSAEVTLTFSKSKTGEECPCEDWVPDSYVNSNDNYGKTELLIGVKNLSVLNDNNEWHHDSSPVKDIKQGEIYAKPTDHVQWRYCYFPGVQFSASLKVTKDNVDPAHPSYMSPTVNHIDNMKFSEAYNFANNFKVKTTALQPSSENVDKTVERAVNDAEVVEGFLPEESTLSNGTPIEDQYVVQQRVQGNDLINRDSGLFYDPGLSKIKTGSITKDDGGQTEVTRDNGTYHDWQCNFRYNQYGQLTGYDTCKHDDDSKLYNNTHIAENLYDQARVYVPYNFTNDVGASLATPEDEVLYAGETVKLENGFARVGTRQNEVTDGDYATEIESGRARLVTFVVDKSSMQDMTRTKMQNVDKVDNYGHTVGDGYYIWEPSAGRDADICDANVGPFAVKNRCADIDKVDSWLNSKGDINGSSKVQGPDGQGYEYYDAGKITNIYDEAAGNYFCVASAIYPYTVKDDKDMEDEGHGDHAWLVSEPDCRVIAKKPTFQVWGAGVYSAGDVETSLMEKNNIGSITSLAGYGWTPWSPTNETLFGSWTELSLTVQAPHTADKMASGAATGYNAGHLPADEAEGRGNGDGNSPGGWSGANQSFCVRSSLSIANDLGAGRSCNDEIGMAETETLRQTLESDKDGLAGRFPALDNYEGVSYRRFDSARVDASSAAINMGETIVNIHGGDITISNDIVYPNGPYTNLAQVPKYIIYAQGSDSDITIECGVTRVDAILMAGGEVKTCGEGYDAGGTTTIEAIAEHRNDDGERSKQLVVNGAIVTGTLTLSRSFGAGTGIHSITPAELINYDSSIYLWANGKAEGVNSGVFTEAASRELAPRY